MAVATRREYLSEKVRSVPPSGIRRFFDIAATMRDVITLGIGEPDFVTPHNILMAGIRSLEEGKTAYTSNSGLVELRELLAAQLRKLYNVEYDPADELLITVGVSEALQVAMIATIDPGDEVIIPEPCFVAYAPAVVFAGGKPISVATHVENNFEVTAAEIEAAITPRSKGILLGYPNNPTGAVMSREGLMGIGKLAEGYDLLIYSDEIYDRLVYGVEHTCVPSLPGLKGRTVLLGGFSKSYAMTGWRIGYAAAPTEILAAMRKVHQYAIMSAPTPAQWAAVEALSNPESELAVQAMLTEYDKRRRFIVDGFNRIGLSCFEPRGAFYAFPSIKSTGLSDTDFSERLIIEQKVAMVPGSAFGPSGSGYVRAAYAASMENIAEALRRVERFIGKL
jgi:aminotransferase